MLQLLLRDNYKSLQRQYVWKSLQILSGTFLGGRESLAPFLWLCLLRFNRWKVSLVNCVAINLKEVPAYCMPSFLRESYLHFLLVISYWLFSTWMLMNGEDLTENQQQHITWFSNHGKRGLGQICNFLVDECTSCWKTRLNWSKGKG